MNPEMFFSAAEAIAGTRGTAPAEAVTNQAAALLAIIVETPGEKIISGDDWESDQRKC